MEKLDDLIVIIPAYEPPSEFVDYANKVASFARTVVVVNDGSNDTYTDIFAEISKNPNVVYLTYEGNHGKGYALKTAFKYCSEHFDKDNIVVRADCDGQHSVEDIVNVYKASKTHKDSLILGSRDINLKIVPKRSRAGNNQIRRMFKFFYGINLYDSQTGLRGATVEITNQLISIPGDRFEYEHAELIYTKRKKIPILETPIKTIYPEEAKDHVSHFRTIKDSARVMGVMLKNLGAYLLSSGIAAILDVVLFVLFAFLIYNKVSLNTSIIGSDAIIAAVLARVLSSIPNFILNRKYVFKGTRKRSIARYYTLWVIQLGLSCSIVYLFEVVAKLSLFPLACVKVLGDLILALLSYQVQQQWVFKNKNNKKFYSSFARFALGLGKRFSKKYRCNVLPYDEPVVYVCRHLNMHGPFTTLKWLNFDVHPLVLNNFFSFKDCYNQYANYTFTERENKKKQKINFKAFFASLVVPKTIRGLKSVPVYRKGVESIKTFNKSMEYLLQNQSLIVYPDIEYTYTTGQESDIYDGFLFLGQTYYKKTGKKLKFIPIYIDDNFKYINECDAITLTDFRAEKEQVKEYLKQQINKKLDK